MGNAIKVGETWYCKSGDKLYTVEQLLSIAMEGLEALINATDGLVADTVRTVYAYTRDARALIEVTNNISEGE